MSINTAGKMPENVVLAWNPIISSVCEIDWSWQFHRDIWANKQSVALLDKIMHGPLILIRRAFLTSITMGIGRLLDHPTARVGRETKENLSFAHLLEIMKGHCNDDTINESLSSKLEDIETHCKLIDIWRNKHFGHADKDMTLGLLDARLPEIPGDTFDQAIAMMRNLLEQIHEHFNGPDSQLDYPERVGDADRFMEVIRAGYEAMEAKKEGFL
jgi:hypothetical protein